MRDGAFYCKDIWQFGVLGQWGGGRGVTCHFER